MKIVVTFAIEEEVIDVPLKDAFIVPIVTGIGKANAAFSLTRAVLLEKPDMVLNIGTAGTQKHSVGDVFVCDHFIDRDLSSTFLELHQSCIQSIFSSIRME